MKKRAPKTADFNKLIAMLNGITVYQLNTNLTAPAVMGDSTVTITFLLRNERLRAFLNFTDALSVALDPEAPLISALVGPDA